MDISAISDKINYCDTWKMASKKKKKKLFECPQFVLIKVYYNGDTSKGVLGKILFQIL